MSRSIPTPLRSSAGLLGLLLLLTYAYFIAPPSWNENSRFNLTRSLLERGRLDIDPYHYNTGDKSFRDGHHYSDKAPGASLVALPAYAAYYGFLRATGGALPASAEAPQRLADDDLPYLVNPSFRRALYVCGLAASALPGAALGVAFFLLLCVPFDVQPRVALLATVTLSLGTLVFPYATLFYGHVLAALALLGAFAVLVWVDIRRAGRKPFVWSGVLAGFAVVAELPCAPAALALAAFAWVASGRRRVVWMFALGAAGPLLLLLIYQALAFGNPVQPGYAYVSRPEFAQGMSRGVMGVGVPQPTVLFEILVGRSRGLLYLAPVLVLPAIGLVRWLGVSRPRASDRLEPMLAAVIVGYFLLMNAGYYMWHGGAALGPRHLIPALPFLCLAWPYAWNKPRVWVLAPLLVVSVANHLFGTAVQPEAPLVDDVLIGHVYAHVIQGELAVPAGASNLGMLLGLGGLWSLLPLLTLWGLGLTILIPLLPGGDGRIIMRAETGATQPASQRHV